MQRARLFTCTAAAQEIPPFPGIEIWGDRGLVRLRAVACGS